MHRRAAQEEQEKMHDFPLVQQYYSHQEAERTVATFLALFSVNTGYHYTQNTNELMVLHIKYPTNKKGNPQ